VKSIDQVQKFKPDSPPSMKSKIFAFLEPVEPNQALTPAAPQHSINFDIQISLNKKSHPQIRKFLSYAKSRLSEPSPTAAAVAAPVEN
jgi:hypothetical protein